MLKPLILFLFILASCDFMSINVYKDKLFDSIKDSDFKYIENHVNKNNINKKNESGLTLLMSAAALGNAKAVTILLEEGADPQIIDSRTGSTALHFAAQSGNVEVIKLLLERGALINQQAATHGLTALMNAVWYRNIEAVQFLLNQPRININLKNSFGISARDYVYFSSKEDLTKNGDFKIMQKLFTDFETRQYTISEEFVEVVMNTRVSQERKIVRLTRLLDDGANINHKKDISGTRFDSYTSLMIAASLGEVQITEFLLENGADITIHEDLLQATALHKAAYKGHVEIVRLLSENDKFLDILNQQVMANGYTALHNAVWQGHIEVVELLLQKRADSEIKAYDGLTPQGLAEKLGEDQIKNAFLLDKTSLEENKKGAEK